MSFLRSNAVSRDDFNNVTQLVMNRLDHLEYGRLRDAGDAITRRGHGTATLQSRSSQLLTRLNTMEARAQGRDPFCHAGGMA